MGWNFYEELLRGSYFKMSGLQLTVEPQVWHEQGKEGWCGGSGGGMKVVVLGDS